ncbi:MAG: hypothetical protein ISS29_06385 [Candidatus Marinimicrobia bacterium]|nr:hypothetical protein [Candidatus Neomarinimicrobiota bacterium]
MIDNVSEVEKAAVIRLLIASIFISGIVIGLLLISLRLSVDGIMYGLERTTTESFGRTVNVSVCQSAAESDLEIPISNRIETAPEVILLK